MVAVGDGDGHTAFEFAPEQVNGGEWGAGCDECECLFDVFVVDGHGWQLRGPEDVFGFEGGCFAVF